MLRSVAAVSIVSLMAALTGLGGCATTDATSLSGARVPADKYAQMFQAARETLRDYRFALDRVDAPQGVLTTAERSDPGWMRPWAANSGSAAAVEDFNNYQQRVVQVAFVAGAAPTHKPGDAVIPKSDPDRDLVEQPVETTMLVRVTVHRVERPERRVSMDSVRVERQAIDPALRDQGMWPSYLVPVDDDTVLAARLLRAIIERSETMQAAAQAAPAAEPQPQVQPAPQAQPQPQPEQQPQPESPR